MQVELIPLSPLARNEIYEQTMAEIKTKSCMPHSYQTLLKENRAFSVGVRMSSSDRLFDQHKLQAGKLTPTGNLVSYSGSQIADIFVNSVRQNHTCWFPLSGDFSNVFGLKYLYLFSKIAYTNTRKYIPFARFTISSVLKQEELTEQQLKTFTDPTLIAYCNFKSVFEITDVKTNDLPQDYLGNASATSVYARAFRGQNPYVLMI